MLGNKLALHFDYGGDSIDIAISAGNHRGREPALRNITSIIDRLNYIVKRNCELVTAVRHASDSQSDYKYYFKKQVL